MTKHDKEYAQSTNLPELCNSNKPRTSAPNRARKTSAALREEGDDQLSDCSDEGSTSKKRRQKKLTTFEVSQISTKKDIKMVRELQSLTYEQKKQGKTDLAEFLINQSPRIVANRVDTSWEIEEASAKLEQARKTRM